jgi:hypothetical protein
LTGLVSMPPSPNLQVKKSEIPSHSRRESVQIA